MCSLVTDIHSQSFLALALWDEYYSFLCSCAICHLGDSIRERGLIEDCRLNNFIGQGKRSKSVARRATYGAVADGGGAVYSGMGMALALSRSDSWPFTPTARSHDRSKHQHADDDQEKDERNEQQDSSAQFADHRGSPPSHVESSKTALSN